MRHFLIFTVLTGLLMTTSCSKHRELLKEQSLLNMEITQKTEELRSLDTQLASLGLTTTDRSILQQQNLISEKKNAALEQDVAELTKKCSLGNELLKEARTKLGKLTSPSAR